ncbi:hypothetical protein VE26_02995 [Devosia chinhatensis]|uniref:Chromosomal replication initiator DnaA C-terminal domain-containing protein n=2 Tax=Devosia chinhatensis TaxID=429727 RepID=A0A0F5FPX1_9HYPH|nr:hypothetical protein VE26_02995 [Devosia chinhatensis]
MAAALVADETKVSKVLIFSQNRCRAKAARARQLAMYLAHVVLGQSLTSVGQAFGRDRTTVSYACALIEDLRDDPAFDADVSRLEQLLETAGKISHD